MSKLSKLEEAREKAQAEFMDVQEQVAGLVDAWPGNERIGLGVALIVNGLSRVRREEGQKICDGLLENAVACITQFNATREAEDYGSTGTSQ